MTDPGSARRRRVTPAERRERRAAVDDPGVVLEAAARFLEVRPRSIAEVRRRLTSAGYRADLAGAAIERLLELEMLDDAAFARAWVESRDRARPRGERGLRQELAVKGVDRDIVDEVLGERRSTVEEDGRGSDPDLAAAAKLLTRQARALERIVDPRARRRRAYALLARSGFDSDTVAEALRDLPLD